MIVWCFSRICFEFGLKCGFLRQPFLNISDRDFFREARVGTRSIPGPTAGLPRYGTWHADIHTHTLSRRLLQAVHPTSDLN